MKLTKIALPLILFLICGAATNGPVSRNLYISDYENVLGTSMQLKIAALLPTDAAAAEKAALDEIDRLNHILSGYDATSEFSRWKNGDKKETKVSAELFDVLSLFDRWRVKTGGALDASAEAIGLVWKAAAKRNEPPTANELAKAVAVVKQQHWELNYTNHTARRLDDVPLMLNSFTKSYIMNKACDAALASGGTTGVVMNIGGDIIVRGTHTEQIQVSNPVADAENDKPVAMLNIKNKAVATSGNYRRGELVNGQWHSHIVDPRTGLPADKIISATVVSDNPSDAGALATALNVLTPADGEKLVASVPHAEFMLLTSEGKRVESKGWKALEIQNNNTVTPKFVSTVNADKLWDTNYELVINLELREIEGMRVHRPYVAIWVVDKDKKPVRSIALWYRKPRYLEDMRAWYEDYYSRFSQADESISSTTSATRPAGKYTLKWDGRNDKGELVKKGVYTIMIEVAREHGTHQLMTEVIDFTKKVNPIAIPENPEVSSASLSYVKKP